MAQWTPVNGKFNCNLYNEPLTTSESLNISPSQMSKLYTMGQTKLIDKNLENQNKKRGDIGWTLLGSPPSCNDKAGGSEICDKYGMYCNSTDKKCHPRISPGGACQSDDWCSSIGMEKQDVVCQNWENSDRLGPSELQFNKLDSKCAIRLNDFSGGPYKEMVAALPQQEVRTLMQSRTIQDRKNILGIFDEGTAPEVKQQYKEQLQIQSPLIRKFQKDFNLFMKNTLSNSNMKLNKSRRLCRRFIIISLCRCLSYLFRTK